MDNQLNNYNAKRNFALTFEPIGRKSNTKSNKLRFIVQHHIARKDHYDFRLEWNGVLLSWAVPKGPSFNPNDKRLAIRVEDHPIDYMNFEGTIPKGQYGGGTVMIWDEGFWIPYSDIEKSLQNGMIKFTLKGKRLKGKWVILKTHEKNWLLIKEKDNLVKNDAFISHFTTSIKTGRTMDEITKGEHNKSKIVLPHISVQLASSSNTLPNGKGWLYELKYDGYRIIAYYIDGVAHLISRNDKDVTQRFKVIANAIEKLPHSSMIFDGEVVAVDASGKSDFQSLQNQSNYLKYVIFDILWLDGKDLREKNLVNRKMILKQELNSAPSVLSYCSHLTSFSKQNFKIICDGGYEGIIAKKADSVYSGNRNEDWLKFKCVCNQEFIIGGYICKQNGNELSSLLLGYYKDSKLIFAGRVGTGWSFSIAKELLKKFEKYKTKESCFLYEPKINQSEKVMWLKPCLAAQIKFGSWTKDNILRHASFIALREDKDFKDIKKDEVVLNKLEKKATNNNNSVNNLIIHGVNITNCQKIVYSDPVLTKFDIATYYEKIGSSMLLYIKNRLLSFVRCPHGNKQICFYRKHPDNNSTNVFTVFNDKGEQGNYVFLTDVQDIIHQIQMNTLEFHMWGSTIKDIDKPDIMVFDLDPDEKMDLNKIRQGVLDLKSVLDSLKLISFLKTSGKKGYHIIVPFYPSVSWEIFKTFAKNIAFFMQEKWPNKYTANLRKENRKGKIFIDWIRNGKGATSIAPYSLRTLNARVSMPIKWDDLYNVAPNEITISEALKRIKKVDPWANFFDIQKKQKFKL